MVSKLTKDERSEKARQVALKRWKEKRKRDAAIIGTSYPEPNPVEVAATIEPPTPIPEPVAAPVAPPKRRKPRMVKEFGVAHSYAEKRLAEAIKERAEAMGRVAMLNAEIPSLVQIIKALGNTPNLAGMQPDFAAQMPITPYVPPSMNGIDPAMMAPIPPIPIAQGGGMGVIPDANIPDENQFLRGDDFTGGGGWR